MIFLIVLGLIGLAGIGATFYAIARDGYAQAPTRDAAFYRSTFDYSAEHTTKETAE